MIIATDRSFRPLGALTPWQPLFEVNELHLNGQLVNIKVFQNLGSDYYSFKKIPGSVFYSPGWEHGYGDDDVAKTPLQNHGIRYEVFGVAW